MRNGFLQYRDEGEQKSRSMVVEKHADLQLLKHDILSVSTLDT